MTFCCQASKIIYNGNYLNTQSSSLQYLAVFPFLNKNTSKEKEKTRKGVFKMS
jgi:hypothetical protein